MEFNLNDATNWSQAWLNSKPGKASSQDALHDHIAGSARMPNRRVARRRVARSNFVWACFYRSLKTAGWHAQTSFGRASTAR